MTKRHAPPEKAEKDIIQRIIDEMPPAPDEVRVDAKQMDRFVGALQEFMASVQPTIQRRKVKHEALRLSAGRAGTSDWLKRVVAETLSL